MFPHRYIFLTGTRLQFELDKLCSKVNINNALNVHHLPTHEISCCFVDEWHLLITVKTNHLNGEEVVCGYLI